MHKPTVYLDTNIFSAYWHEMAVSAAHEVDYLLTWNYAHLANPIAQKRLEAICGELHLRAPFLVSPESIPQVRFGQTIRRRG
jgi:hypothetical protein